MFEGQKPEDVLSCKCVVLVFPAAPSQPNERERERDEKKQNVYPKQSNRPLARQNGKLLAWLGPSHRALEAAGYRGQVLHRQV